MILLGGSWVVISEAISLLIWVMTIVILLRILVITTHEPPSNPVLYLRDPEVSP